MEKIWRRIIYKLVGRHYLDKHIRVYQIAEVITSDEVAQVSPIGRTPYMKLRFDDMIQQLTKKALADGAILCTRENKDEYGGELITAKLKVWIETAPHSKTKEI